MNKPYDGELDKCSKPAEWAVLSWLLDVGFTVTDHPQGDTGPDIHVARLGKVSEEFIVEVEHMGADRTDDQGDLKYPTLSVLARRKLSDRLPTLIFHVTNNLRHALIVFDRDFKCTAPKPACVSRNNPAGESKKYVAVERVLKVRIGTQLDQPFAEINADRVRDAIENETDVECVRRFLSPVRPYGMSGVEWRSLLDRLSSGWLVQQSLEAPF
jgi:hypothetical protein